MTRENELLKKIAKGETEYWEELIGMYYEDILRYCIYHAPDKTGGRRCGTGDISEGDPVYAGLQTSWEIPGILIQGGRKHLQRPVEEMHKRRMV